MTTAFDHTALRIQLLLLSKTQQEFAHDLGVSITTVSRWLCGKTKPNKLTINAINNLLQCYINSAA